MRKNFTLLLIALVFGVFSSFGQVIISQIYEGASFNKYIEITNIGSSSVDLTSPQLTVKLFANKAEIGANAPTAYKNLSGTLAAGQSLLVRHGQAAGPAYAIAYTPFDTSAACNFNGDVATTPTDIIALYNGTTLVDVFAWGTYGYKDKSVYRNAAVNAPNTTWTESEWTSEAYTVADDAPAGVPARLGYHGAPSTAPYLNITAPAQSSTIYSADVTVNYTVSNFVVGNPGVGIDGHLHYKVDGGAIVMIYDTNPIALTGLTEGNHKVIMELVDNSHASLVPPVIDSVSFTVNLTPPPQLTIYNVQYTTNANGDSPYKDSIVTVNGICTAKGTSGYYIQNGAGAWNGIYVYDNVNQPVVGDNITITGLVAEYNSLTEIKNISSYVVNSSGNTLPAATVVTTGGAKNEQYEGCLVKVEYARCNYVNATGWWEVLQGTDTLEVGKVLFTYQTPVVGTYYDVTGVIDYYFDFKIQPRNAGDIMVNTGIEDAQLHNGISAFPNPAHDMIKVVNLKNNSLVEISNILGQKIAGYSNMKSAELEIDLSGYNNGIYFISVKENNRTVKTIKISKN